MHTTLLNRNRLLIAIAALAIIAIAVYAVSFKRSASKESTREVSPAVGNIAVSISATGGVEPENRLEVKPPIAGRIIEILVKEGDKVREGQVIAWMSSTERAAILDAAKAMGENEFRRWQDSYKPTPLISPINGEVIVSTDQPGQTVTTSEAIVVLSDKLIVKAQVDETDIGRVRSGQRADIGLDAYPDIKVGGAVERISYESTVVNNVTTYQVYIVPDTIPDVFRSGMSTNVEIIEDSRENVMLLPRDAIKQDDENPYVVLAKKSVKQPVKVGLCDDKICEIISGLKGDENILVTTQKYQPSTNSGPGSSPFMPGGRRR